MQSTAALPWTTIIIILVIWALVTIPLCVLGGIMGKNNRGDFRCLAPLSRLVPGRCSSLQAGHAAYACHVRHSIHKMAHCLARVRGLFCTTLACMGIHRATSSCSAPCRTNKYPREIPELPWYRQALPQMVMAGFLPFSAIYIELYYIFASVWGHKACLSPCGTWPRLTSVPTMDELRVPSVLMAFLFLASCVAGHA